MLIASLARRASARRTLHVELAVLQGAGQDRRAARARAAGGARPHASNGCKPSFDSVAGASLRSNSELFLKLAREHLGQHQQSGRRTLTEREKAIEAMLAPIREALGKTEQQMQRIEKERAETFGSLKSSLESVALGQQALQKETRTLVNALRRPEVRGQWGEMTLRRLAELAGMVEHCDFSEQVHVRAEDGNLRPDMIVHMPDGRDLVVDVKTPLDAYLEAVDATERRSCVPLALRRHAQAVAERVRQLGAKSYWSQFEKSPGLRHPVHSGRSVPVRGAGRDADLLEDAIRQDVIIATPSSFVALLKAVAYGWRQTALAQNAETIRTLGRGSVQAPRRVHRATSASSAATSAAASMPSTAPSARSNARCCPARASSPSSACDPDREIESLEPIDQLTREPHGSEDRNRDRAQSRRLRSQSTQTHDL